MTKRILVTLGIMMLAGSPILAQQPTVEESGPTPAPVEPAPSAVEPGWGECQPTPPAGSRWWATGDLVVGWISGVDVPPLVTTSTPLTSKANAGILGRQSTTVLFGDQETAENGRMGIRLGIGYWFDCDRKYGVEAGFMALESQATLFSATSSAARLPILARPYFDANTNLPQAVLIAFPGDSTGSVEVRVSSGSFYEAHIDLTENFVNKCCFRLDSILGYRFYRYDEGLRVRQTVFPQNPNFVPGTRIVSVDDFNAQNQFHGLDIGLRAEFCWHNVLLTILAKGAAGCINHDINIQGSQTTTVPGAGTSVQEGGVFALSSNIGNHPSYDWAVLPEFGASASWQLNCHVRLHGGYSIMWLNQMARAMDQVDLTLNPNLFPPPVDPVVGPRRPAFNLELSDIWLQTLSLGLEFRF